MILEVITSIDWTQIITGGIGVITGGALLGLYNAWIGKRKGDAEDERSYEESLRNRISDLESKVDLLTDKITKLVESNSEVVIKLSSENAALIARNQHLHDENGMLKEHLGL